MADDVDAPHDKTIEIDADLDLAGIADVIARTSYLPMPSDAWGWTIEMNDVAVAIRPRRVTGRWTQTIRGDPALVTAADLTSLRASYIPDPAARLRTYSADPPSGNRWVMLIITTVVVAGICAVALTFT